MAKPIRPCEKLSKRQREATPPLFASYLIGMVRTLRQTNDPITVLFVQSTSVYWRFWPAVELWGVGRDAKTYGGPGPIIAHPPCGPWGKYRHRSHQDPQCGIIAMRQVHAYGGVVEQPVGSSLFKEYGGRGIVTSVFQYDYGHAALKPTILYWVI